MAAVIRRRRFHCIVDDAGDRDRELCAVDLAAEGRDRQQARRFRIREDRVVIFLHLSPLAGRGRIALAIRVWGCALPLSPCGRGWLREAKTGEGSLSADATPHP